MFLIDILFFEVSSVGTKADGCPLSTRENLQSVLFGIACASSFVLTACGIEVVGHLQSDTTSRTVVIAILTNLNAVRAHLPFLEIGIKDVVDGEIKGQCTIEETLVYMCTDVPKGIHFLRHVIVCARIISAKRQPARLVDDKFVVQG